MYWGSKRIGTVNPGEFANPRFLAINCEAYSGGGVVINRQGTWVVAFSAMNYNFGYARLLGPGKWPVYAAEVVGSSHSRLVGYAERRTLLQWDVIKGYRRVGHTVGPDGPQAVAALLLVC
jgi:hypothetical protein